MAKEKFVYNNQTLRYERVVVTVKERMVKVFGWLSGATVTTLIVLSIAYKIFPSPREKTLLGEIQQLELKYSALDKHISMMERALSSVQQRDSGIYRRMFMMEPLNSEAGGTGGHDRFTGLQKYASANIIVSAQERIEQLSRLIAQQSKSLDTLQRLAREKDKMWASLPSIKPVREDKLSSNLTALSGFGMRFHPIHKTMKLHKGMDFSAGSGTPIQAAADGEIIAAAHDGGYGNCVRISHGYGYVTLYAHMSRMTVKVGQKIKKGEQIGLVGSTGASTGPHCHYEVHLNGVPVNPLQFCLDGLTPLEYQALANAASQKNQSFD